VARSDAIIFTELGDTVVMMDVEVGLYYELNATGARVWTLLESAPRVAEVCRRLVAEYEVAADTCGDEVRAILDRLCRLRAIRILPGGDPKGSDGKTKRTVRNSVCETVTSGTAATPRQGKESDATLAWTTPDVRIMDTRRVASMVYRGSFRNPESPTYDFREAS
jgi:hypothetical protein